VIPRLWVCTDRPAVLEILALPLHVLVLLGFVVIWGTLQLTNRQQLAWRLGRLTQLLFLVLGSLTTAFAVVGMLLGLLINPSGFLELAPWAWSLAGPIALVLAVKRARREVMGARGPSGAFYGHPAVATTAAVLAFGLIAARYAISDSDNRVLSIPYRLFDWAVIDELGPVTDECLTSRVLEYSQDDGIGRDAVGALARRGPSAVSGMRARLAELREHWPPPDYTIKTSGIDLLLAQLLRFGDAPTVREWEDFGWRDTFPHPKPEDRALPLSH
jgi:hypothetical protein